MSACELHVFTAPTIGLYYTGYPQAINKSHGCSSLSFRGLHRVIHSFHSG